MTGPAVIVVVDDAIVELVVVLIVVVTGVGIGVGIGAGVGVGCPPQPLAFQVDMLLQYAEPAPQ